MHWIPHWILTISAYFGLNFLALFFGWESVYLMKQKGLTFFQGFFAQLKCSKLGKIDNNLIKNSNLKIIFINKNQTICTFDRMPFVKETERKIETAKEWIENDKQIKSLDALNIETIEN